MAPYVQPAWQEFAWQHQPLTSLLDTHLAFENHSFNEPKLTPYTAEFTEDTEQVC